MTRVPSCRISTACFAKPRLWRIALLTVAGAMATSPRAEAAYFYWRNSFAPGYYYGPGYYYDRPAPYMPRLRPRMSHPVKQEHLRKQTGVKPAPPLIIEVSVRKQRVIVYDANGFFAEAPVSTGMRSHPTPLGVFSVIQKQKWHRSNMYSDAPMPYMQRITWSGIAMHAGVLPGYRASHGCIRMPTAFAIKMYHWTRMGARVLVTPNAVAPQSFSHPLLPAVKVQPPPAAANAAQPISASATESKIVVDSDKSQAKAPAVSNALPPIGTGRISVLISGKDSRLYVRQKFAPLFDVPVTIAPSDRPLGTHVFTADADKNVLHWTVVSLPGPSPLREAEARRRRRGRHRIPAEAKPLPVADSAAEALDRITIPPGVMTRIAAAITTGSSIIVSDQGIRQGETGKGTGFIVSLR